MSKHFVAIGLMVGALAIAPSVEAATISAGSTLSITGAATPVTGTTTVGSSWGTATGVDFGNQVTQGAGIAGDIRATACSGDFLTVFTAAGCDTVTGALGKIKDISFAGAGSASYPLPPISNFELFTSPSFAFDLLTIAVTQQISNQLDLSGTGTLKLAGYDPTPGTFIYSSQGAGSGTFSFSATNTAVAPIPEPASLTLLGTGLVGLAGAARRRLRKA